MLKEVLERLGRFSRGREQFARPPFECLSAEFDVNGRRREFAAAHPEVAPRCFIFPTVKDESLAVMPIDGYAGELGVLWFDDRAIPRRPRPDISEERGRRSDWHRRVAREEGHSKSISAFGAHRLPRWFEHWLGCLGKLR